MYVQYAASQETRLVVRLELPHDLMRSMEACCQPSPLASFQSADAVPFLPIWFDVSR